MQDQCPGELGDEALRRRHVRVAQRRDAGMAQLLEQQQGLTAGGQHGFGGMQIDLGLSVDQANAANLIPTAASLLVVFAAGTLSDRWGYRRLLVYGAITYGIGAILVGLSQGFGTVMLGRAMGGVGGVTLGIVGLAAVNASFESQTQRAKAFAAFAALIPAVSFLFPPVGAVLRTEPGCASAAESAADRPVQLETPAQRLLRSSQSGWNPAQFDIRHSANTRRGQLLVQGLRRMAYAPAWRAARWGLLALIVSGLLGLGTRMLHQAGVHEELVHTVISSCWSGAPAVLEPGRPCSTLLN
jgi:MFS family permease